MTKRRIFSGFLGLAVSVPGPIANLSAVLLSSALLGWAAPVAADLTMGVFPRRPAAATVKAFTPLAEKLAAELGEPVKLVVARDFPSFWKSVEAGEFDIVHYNQYHYLLSRKVHGYRAFAANEEFGKRTIAGALSVRKDSGIKSVMDLKGKTILFGGGKKAFGSYIAPTAVLKAAGLVEGRDYEARFAKNPPSAVVAVFNKAADVAGSGDVVLGLNAVTSKIDIDQVDILALSDAFVQLPWAVKGSVSVEQEQRIKTVMLGLKGNPAGDAVLQAAGVSDFFEVSDADFGKVREIVAVATGEAL